MNINIKQGLISINGNVREDSAPAILASDSSFMFGWGVFETLRIYKGIPFMLSEHLVRLQKAAASLAIPFVYEEGTIQGYVRDLINKAELKECVLRITLSRGCGNNPNIIITHRPVNYMPADYERGFTLKCSTIRRNPTSPLVFLKTVNYMENIMARNAAQLEGFNEALFLNNDNNICECSTSNIFFIKGKKVYTPSVECGLLDGIARGLLVDKLIAYLGLEVQTGKFTLNDLYSAEEVFVTNSVMQVMPVVRVEHKTIGTGIQGVITAKLMQAYNSFVLEYCK